MTPTHHTYHITNKHFFTLDVFRTPFLVLSRLSIHNLDKICGKSFSYFVSTFAKRLSSYLDKNRLHTGQLTIQNCLLSGVTFLSFPKQLKYRKSGIFI
jgi:hypothetical protein